MLIEDLVHMLSAGMGKGGWGGGVLASLFNVYVR